MKKTIAIVLAAAMLVGLVACAGKNEKVNAALDEIKVAVSDVKEGKNLAEHASVVIEEVEPATTPEPEEKKEESIIGMANPWHESTQEEILDKAGFNFVVPEGATDVKFWLMETEKEILPQMYFTLDGNEYLARMEDISEFTDISGMYYTWDKEEKFELATEAKKMHATDGQKQVNVALWIDMVPGVMYSVSCVSDEDVDIEKVARLLYVPLQGEDEGDVTGEVSERIPVEVTGSISVGERIKDIELNGTYYEDEVYQDEKDFGMVSAYYTENRDNPDIDVWRFAKQGFTLEEYTALDALAYGAADYTLQKEWGIPSGYYVAVEEYANELFITHTHTMEDGDEFVQVVFWDKTDEIDLADTGLAILASTGFKKTEESAKAGAYDLYVYADDNKDVANFRISGFDKNGYNLHSLIETYKKAYDGKESGLCYVNDEYYGWISGIEIDEGGKEYQSIMYFVDCGDKFVEIDFFAEDPDSLYSAAAVMSTLYAK